MLKNEKKILLFIRYAPLIFIFILSLIINIFLIEQKKSTFKHEIKELEANYIQVNKEVTKQEILDINNYIKIRQSNIESQLKKRLKEGVLNAYKVVKAIYEQNKNRSEDEIKKRIVETLEPLRFNDKRTYFIVNEAGGRNLLHPMKKEIQGKNIWNLQDAKGSYFVQNIQKTLDSKKQTFTSWYWYKPNDEKIYKKIGFFIKFEKLNIAIGASDFVTDYENSVKQEVLFYIQSKKAQNNKYIFVLDFKGIYLNHFDETYVGKNVAYTHLIPNNEIFFSQMLKIARQGGFVKYPYMKPNSNEIVQKTSYVLSDEKWKWLIGTGFYMDDFQKEVQKRKEQLDLSHTQQKNNLLLLMALFTLILLVISILISKLLEKRFFAYRAQIHKQLQESIKKDNLLAYQSKMASMGEMIGNIAHQWRQPLSTISAAATGIKVQKELGILTEELESEELESIKNNVNYLSKTIDDFRNFLKPNKQKTLFRIDEVIERTLKLVAAQYRNKDIEIIKDIEVVSLVALENELLQVLINILNNARDELLKIEGKRYIFISAKQIKNSLVIEIKDNAKGIKKKIIKKIFEAYFTTKKDDEGTGIGLFMSKEIIVKHLGGTLEAFNEKYEYKGKEYKGAKFVIIVPLEN